MAIDATIIRQLQEQFSQFAISKGIQPNPFVVQLTALSQTPLKYEHLDLQEDAMAVMPLERIFSEADENKDESLGYQDKVIKAMMNWFKNEFFKWVGTKMNCDFCGKEEGCKSVGSDSPNLEEQKDGAGRVEIFKCDTCGYIYRFGRYNDCKKLLRTRRGRCGEWANCFTLLCRTLGSQARWVWNAEDHVWTEIYSDHMKRWIHLDSCENAFDQPRLYEEGWGKKMSYCIAFSADGASDVSKRYVRGKGQLPRTNCSEAALEKACKQLSDWRRFGRETNELSRLQVADQMEKNELESLLSNTQTTTSNELKPRESGDTEWKSERKEDGSNK